MSFKTFFANLPAEIEGIPAELLALMKGPAGKAMASFAETAGGQVLAIVMAAPQAVAIKAIVTGVTGANADGTAKTGTQKMAEALPGVIALVGEIARDVANPAAAAIDLVGAETVARQAVETVLVDAQATTAGSAATAIAAAAGVKLPTPASIAAKV